LEFVDVDWRPLVAGSLPSERLGGLSRCEVELVEKEVVGVDDLDVEGFGRGRREVADVEGDDRVGVATDGGGEDVRSFSWQVSPGMSAW